MDRNLYISHPSLNKPFRSKVRIMIFRAQYSSVDNINMLLALDNNNLQAPLSDHFSTNTTNEENDYMIDIEEFFNEEEIELLQF